MDVAALKKTDFVKSVDVKDGDLQPTQGDIAFPKWWMWSHNGPADGKVPYWWTQNIAWVVSR